MKKHLFFAAFALSMMASCTNDDNLVVEQPTAPEDDRVAIQLGVDAPSITATGRAVSRGTGSVGDVEDENNNWNGQRLYIAMVDKDGNLAKQVEQNGLGEIQYEADGKTPKMENILDWTRLDYYAPTTGETGDIVINQLGSTTVQQYEYYPVYGKFDFYGWHVDDAEITEPATNIKIEAGEAYVNNITINGTQDIMGARTKEFNQTNYTGWTGELADWAFSARTARAEVKPILKFEHQLARLKFFVRAGSDGTGLQNADDTYNTKDGQQQGESLAMYVTALSVEKMVSIIDMNLNAALADGSKGIETKKCTDLTPAQELVTFQLGTKIDGKVVPGTLTPVAPAKTYDGTDGTKGTQIGESIMFLPDEDSKKELTLNLVLKQTVKDTETAGDPNPTYSYIDKIQDAKLTVKASSIAGAASDNEFKPGYSYNIYITVYGFERIEVTAELDNWKDGGNVDVDVEEGVSKHEVDLTFNVTASDNAVITPTYAYEVNGEAIADTDNSIKVESYSTVKYTISAPGYVTATGYVNAEKGGKTAAVILQKDNAQTPAPAEQVTYTIIPTPADATVTINDVEQKTVTVDKESMVVWEVKKEGYITKRGTVSVNADYSETVTLVEGFKITTEAKDAANDGNEVAGTVELKVDGVVVTSSDEIEVGKKVEWTVITSDDPVVVYGGEFTVESGKTTYTLVCDESSKK